MGQTKNLAFFYSEATFHSDRFKETETKPAGEKNTCRDRKINLKSITKPQRHKHIPSGSIDTAGESSVLYVEHIINPRLQRELLIHFV
jgi:hypothetical protein